MHGTESWESSNQLMSSRATRSAGIRKVTAPAFLKRTGAQAESSSSETLHFWKNKAAPTAGLGRSNASPNAPTFE